MNSLNHFEINSNNSHSTTETTIKIRLHDGTWVDQKLYESILQRIKTVIPTLNPKINYIAEKLCGKAFWDQLEKCDRINAGKCLVHMVKNDLLPLNNIGKNDKNSKLYRLK